MGGQFVLAAAVRWVAARAPDLAPLHLRRCSSEPVPGNLNEAHATEVGLVRVLQSQIAMSPRGRYRTGLEKHLRETEAHADKNRAGVVAAVERELSNAEFRVRRGVHNGRLARRPRPRSFGYPPSRQPVLKHRASEADVAAGAQARQAAGADGLVYPPSGVAPSS